MQAWIKSLFQVSLAMLNCIFATLSAYAGEMSLHILCKPQACCRKWIALMAPNFISAGDAIKPAHCCCRKNSTWSQRDWDLLAQMSQQFVSDISASTRDCVYGYMAAMLPGKAIPDIAGHNDWYCCVNNTSSMRMILRLTKVFST